MTKTLQTKQKLELYFHIPFCVKKCLYCDFLSAPSDKETQNAYMQALLWEVQMRSEEYREYVVDTIFIGGGTPSIVDVAWIERLLWVVHQNYEVSKDAEITIEVNPKTVDEKKLECYVKAGINRLSIGLQSANDEELKRIGRIHTWKDFQETYDLARAAGFQNINVDIMSALPKQTLDSYQETLEKVLRLKPQPEHISAYSLIVEEGTAFHTMEKKGILELPTEECERQMYEQTAKWLKCEGYARYEISNYAKEDYACRHNCGYWQRTDYVGFGIGAASLVQNTRFQNGDSLKAYLADPLHCRRNLQELTVVEQMEEFMFLGLRMMEGVDENSFQRMFGKTLSEVYGAVINQNIADGLLEYDKKVETGNRKIRLTKRGMDLSNYVMAQFLFD